MTILENWFRSLTIQHLLDQVEPRKYHDQPHGRGVGGLVCAAEETTVETALHLLHQHRIHALPVYRVEHNAMQVFSKVLSAFGRWWWWWWWRWRVQSPPSSLSLTLSLSVPRPDALCGAA